MAVLADPPRPLFGFLDVRTLAIGLAIAAFVYTLNALVIWPYFFSPLRNLPGPGRGNLLFGHLREIIKGGPGEYHVQWSERYGPVVRYFVAFGNERLMLSDPKALHFMLHQNAYDYPKPALSRQEVGRLLGKGVIFAEGEDHRRQRRILNPAFINSHIARLVPVFFQKAHHLAEKFAELVDADASDAKAPVVNVDTWLSRCTLDIIGKAGLGYEFGALDNSDNQLAQSFQRMMGASSRQGALLLPILMLTRYFPFLLKIPTERLKRVQENMDAMTSESRKIVENKRLTDPEHKERDLMSLLLKANDSETGKSALSDEELRGQLTTFILAGHETTSTALTWALHWLSVHPEIQSKLRAEVRQILPPHKVIDGLSFEQLNTLPYLDAVTRETLRLNPPVPGTIRESRVESVIPLSKPLSDGSTSIYVPAGQTFFVSILNVNMNESLWGPDAKHFKPERWLNADGLSDRVKEETSQYTMWGNQLTFLGGTRACIGYRFALAEFKAILCALVTEFEFSSGVPEGCEISKRSLLVTKPFIKGREKEGSQMPLRVKRAD